MQVGVLGPVAVTRSDGTVVALGARKQREIVGLLALDLGAVTPADVLADRLWRGSPPRSWASTLQGYVFRVRRALGPDAGALVAAAGGYRLVPAMVELDAAEVGRDVAQARRLLDVGDAVPAAAQLAATLARWRGTPFAEIADCPAAEPVVARLEEVRLDGEQLLARARISGGRPDEAVPRLRELHAAHPLHEGVAELLVTALYRTGRQSDALAVLARLRARLRDELGVDPAPALTRLETAVLRQDPALSAGTRPAAGELPLRGRDDELRGLRRAWRRAADGVVCAAVVSGEPGIGKTTLVDALAREARAAGADVRRARGTDVDGAPPFWMWHQLLAFDPPARTSRFAIGLDVARRVRDLTASRPLLLVLDDLQWADADSLAVLEAAAGLLSDVAVLVAVTCRSGARRPEVTGALAALARLPGVRLDLGRLGEAAIEAVLTDRGMVPGALTTRVVRRAGGNPFFAGELADLALTGIDPGSVLPAAVREAVTARVGRLPPTVLSLLRTAAVLGREIDPALLAEVGDGDVDAGLPVLADAGLVAADASGRFAFQHDLLREAVLDGLLPGHRSALHHAVADALAARPGAAAAEAIHRSAAARGRVDAAAAAACLRAARHALVRGGDDDAHDLARRGLGHAGTDAEREDLLRVAAQALVRAGRLEEADAARAEEAATVRARRDWPRLADIALAANPPGLGGYWTQQAAVLSGAGSLLAEALRHAGDLGPAHRCALTAAEAVRRGAVGRPGAPHLADEAADHAADVHGPDAHRAAAHADIAHLIAHWGPQTISGRLARAERLMGSTAGDAQLEPTALHLLRVVQLEAGHFADSHRTARRFGDLATARPDPDLALAHVEWSSMWDLLRGDHAAARGRIEAIAADMDRLAPAAATILRTSVATVAGITAWQQGRLVELVGDIDAVAADGDEDFRLVTALGLAQGRRTGRALEMIGHLLADHEKWDGPRATIRTAILAEALVTVLDGEPATAERRSASEQLDLLSVAVEEWQDGMVVLWPGSVCLGPTTLYRGSVRAALGRAGAADDLRRAAAVATAAGARPYGERAAARRR